MESIASRPPLRLARPQRIASPLSNGVLAMLIFVVMEVMLFAGFISAFTIVRAGALPGMWPPPHQPTLPATQTLLNTAALFASAICLVLAHLAHRRERPSAQGWLAAAWGLGALFVGLQGKEWVALLAQGLTLTSSSLGGFFYLIVGAHGLHALVALAALVVAWVKLRRGTLERSFLDTVQVFWYFVVVLWPVIYGRVYF